MYSEKGFLDRFVCCTGILQVFLPYQNKDTDVVCTLTFRVGVCHPTDCCVSSFPQFVLQQHQSTVISHFYTDFRIQLGLSGISFDVQNISPVWLLLLHCTRVNNAIL
mmetsp:Transcript_105151/g.206243  ORF Transcript_105151/g.206243 Transcript_105151/m.206243 type:complete len:107 (-) Transcript_105151:4135-4455(-)